MRALAILLVLATAARARADDLDDARKLEASLEYERALALVEGAIARGDAHDVAVLHFEAGKIAAGLDRALEAEDHFARALELDPSLALPEDTSPKLTAPFYAARSHVEPLRVAHASDGLHLSVTIEADAMHLVASARVETHQEELVARAAPFEFTLPAPGDATLVLLDEHGNRLHEERLQIAAPRPLIAQPRWYARWQTWAIASASIAAAGAVCAWRENVAQDDWNALRADTMPHDYSQLRAIEDRGRAWALAANLSFGLAAAAGIASTTLAITATPSGIGVAGRF